MTVFRARHIELGAMNRRDPLDAWDIPTIAEHYESFIDRWSLLLPRIRSQDVGGSEAVKARTQVMDTYRLFPVLDPQLPLSLLPSAWLRDPVRELFTAVYDGLAEAAQAHVRSVTGQFAAAHHQTSKRTRLLTYSPASTPVDTKRAVARPVVGGAGPPANRDGLLCGSRRCRPSPGSAAGSPHRLQRSVHCWLDWPPGTQS
jgi:phenylacetic acid degradation operon negative regulatory protein